jgi:hypothetical protein
MIPANAIPVKAGITVVFFEQNDGLLVERLFHYSLSVDARLISSNRRVFRVY